MPIPYTAKAFPCRVCGKPLVLVGYPGGRVPALCFHCVPFDVATGG